MKRIRPLFLVIMAVVAAGLILVIVRILSSHDEPLVIDNGPLMVHRTIRETPGGPVIPPDPEGGDPRHWHFHHSWRLRDMFIQVWDDDGNEGNNVMTPVSLSGVDEIVVELIDTAGGPAPAPLTIRRDAFLTRPPGDQGLHLDSPDLPFAARKRGDDYHLELDPPKDSIRIRQIRVNDDTFCVRDQLKPT